MLKIEEKNHVKLTVFGIFSMSSISFAALISDFIIKKAIIQNYVIKKKYAMRFWISYFDFLSETFKVLVTSDTPDFPNFYTFLNFFFENLILLIAYITCELMQKIK